MSIQFYLGNEDIETCFNGIHYLDRSDCLD